VLAAILLVAATLLPRAATRASTFETLINNSFTSYSALETTWDYRYPWGSDHNGSARMYASSTDHDHVIVSSGVLTLKATHITWDEGTSTSSPHLAIHYHSGAIHARDQIVVTDQFPSYEVRGEFQAPATRGAWPAFWLTGANTWPPESDILEYKGDARNWFNTFRGSSDVSSTVVPVSTPGSWHQYRAWIARAGATGVTIDYSIDGVWQARHQAANFVGKPMWLIINLQMEGSSGGPGPTADTSFLARNVYVGRTRTS